MKKKQDDTIEEPTPTPEVEQQLETPEQEAARKKEDVIEATQRTLSSLMLQTLCDLTRNMQMPWQQMTEDQQREWLDRAGTQTDDIIKKAVRLIAAEDRPIIYAELEQITIKDGVKGVFKMAMSNPNRHTLYDFQGKNNLILIDDSDEYTGGHDIEPDPQQPELGLDEEVEE